MIGAPAPSWFARNRRWALPTLLVGGALAAAAAIAIFVGLILEVLRSSGAYTGAMERVQGSAEVATALGVPLEPGWFVTGSVHVSGPNGSAALSIPVSGPRGRGTIYVQARKRLGLWHFDGLVVAVAASGARIDLSEPRQSAGAREP